SHREFRKPRVYRKCRVVTPGEIADVPGVPGHDSLGEIFDEPVVEVDEPQEGLYLFDLGWGWPVQNSADLHGVHRDAPFGDDELEVFDSRPFELALLRFQEQPPFPQRVQNLADDLPVLLQG